MIKANCRDRFTAEDFDFVVETLSKSERDSVNLVKLLTDNEARDSILDHPRLVDALAEQSGALRISPQLYFYLLIRHVLKETDLNDRAISDYVASLLENFSQTHRICSPANGMTGPIQYVSDMLIALRDASPSQSFLIRAHVGNYSLFITGIFHETVQSRSQRGGPDVGFYEGIGSANYKAIASHKAARSAALSSVYGQLADGFHEMRLALNKLSDTLIHLDGGLH
ncbi:MAG: hypothetical protein JWL90_3551 [Chthoniobacteraceae bacterium]|nr:hypothetical protein [Chthoniobacteraceae bacterium]MDB6171308.1 hypothetical protein [Chthoniobacteraceae bacterium]